MRTTALLLLLLAGPATAAAQLRSDAGEARADRRFVVESVDLLGAAETALSQELRDQLQQLVGRALDVEEARRLEQRLAAELPGRDVRRRIARGIDPDRIRVVFEVTETLWIPFAPARGKAIYHGTQGWSAALDVPIGDRQGRVVLGLVLGNGDDLIEEYSGYRVRAESRRLGGRRFGASVDAMWLRQRWEPETLSVLAADARIPSPYRRRLTVEPAATFAVNAHLRLAGGVGFSRLESLSRSPETGQVHAWIGSIGYDRTWESGPGSSSLQAGYQVRHGAGGLGSDLVYTRHTGRARYEHEYGRSTVLYTLILGGISGRAPLFERFTLGDSSTLRGWDKYDVAPAGGDRMMHQSIEYRYRLIGVFVDAGAVWDGRRDARVRLASGAGVLTDGFFLTLGFPLNADRASATLMAGVRF